MTIHHKPVFSSHVNTVGYDDATGELHVAYRNGKVSIYEGIPPEVAIKAQGGAASIGKLIHDEIRGKYGHRYG